MAYYIAEDCISCAACEPEWPNQTISEEGSIFIINPDRCTECVGSYESSRCAAVCPVEPCHPDPKKPETKVQLLQKWQGLNTNETPISGAY